MSASLNYIQRRGDRFNVVLAREDGGAIEVDCSATDLSNYTRLQSKILLAAGVRWTEPEMEHTAKATERRKRWLELIEWGLMEGDEVPAA